MSLTCENILPLPGKPPRPEHLSSQARLQCRWLAGDPGWEKWFLRPGGNVTFSWRPPSLPLPVLAPEDSRSTTPGISLTSHKSFTCNNVIMNSNECMNDICPRGYSGQRDLLASFYQVELEGRDNTDDDWGRVSVGRGPVSTWRLIKY